MGSLDPISETLVESLNHKTPAVRCETASFLARSFSYCTMTTLPKKLLKMFVTPLMKVCVKYVQLNMLSINNYYVYL